MKITYHGHSCFIIEADKHRIIIDPFLSGNPAAKIKPKDVKVEAVLVSHGHSDHLGDAVEISKNNNATIIAPFELVNYCTARGAMGHAMHIGGSHEFPFGRVKLTIAHHGSTTDTGATGNPCGFIVAMEGKDNIPRRRHRAFFRYETHRRNKQDRCCPSAHRRQFYNGC